MDELGCGVLASIDMRLRDNEIDWEALPKLTAEDLKDLGAVLGTYRQLLLGAIMSLRTEAANVVAVSPDLSVRTDVERRQLTVIYANIPEAERLAHPPSLAGGLAIGLRTQRWNG